jgi:F0F1-type ATP synthase membrane subunit b/b'
VGFLIGLVVGAVGVVTFKDFARPVAKNVVKTGIRFARIVQEAGAEVAEELSDIKAEAEADLQTEPKPARKTVKPVQ